jgi:hypothetical protein
MISANLNASTLMIADKASDMIRGRTPLEAQILAASCSGIFKCYLARAPPCLRDSGHGARPLPGPKSSPRHTRTIPVRGPPDKGELT